MEKTVPNQTDDVPVERTCETCYFWMARINGPGECHCMPVQVMKFHDDWCGQWKLNMRKPKAGAKSLDESKSDPALLINILGKFVIKEGE